MNDEFSPHRILLALSHLHKQRFEHLRISCGRSPSGMQWRYMILPRHHFMPENGLLISGRADTDHYPHDSLNGNEHDLPSPEKMAAVWLKQYPILHQTALPDINYVEWYQSMLDGLGDWDVPVMYADWEIDFDNGFCVGKKILPLPAF